MTVEAITTADEDGVGVDLQEAEGAISDQNTAVLVQTIPH
jgi:hypothetical protein